MQTRRRANRGDRLIAAHLVVFAFFFLALCVTAAGTSRFALAVGYSEAFGYAVGVVLELGKAVLPIVIMRLVVLGHPRAYILAAAIGIAGLGLVTYSALATHATVSSAIASRERMGTWHMETRSGTQTELATRERQLAAISITQPRPVTTVRQALAAEKVPPGIWRESKECQNIRDSAHFQKACNKVLQLRRELAAAEDHERLSNETRALREKLAAAPIVATSDPLSEAFDATLGRRLPIKGRAGVAMLLTLVLEIMSSCGPAALRVLKNASSPEEPAQPRASAAREVAQEPTKSRTREARATERGAVIASKFPPRPRKSRARRRAETRTGSRDATRSRTGAGRRQRACSSRPSSPRPVISDRPASSALGRRRRTSPRQSSGSPGRRACACNVADFVHECVKRSEGASTSAAALRVAYPSWCIARGDKPVSGHRLGSELKKLGLEKWKSNGRIRYRDLRLRA